MPCRSGSPQGVLGTGACADVRVTDIEMTAPSAAAAMATAVIVPANRAIMTSPGWMLLQQRIRIIDSAGCVVLGQRIRTFPLRKGNVFQARRLHQGRKAYISFDATRLVVDPVLLIALFRELLLDGPGPRPHGPILDGHGIVERGWAGPGPALDQVQVLARAAIVVLWAEIRHIDH